MRNPMSHLHPLWAQLRPLARAQELLPWAEKYLAPSLVAAALLLLLLVALIFGRRATRARRRLRTTGLPSLPAERLEPTIERPPSDAELDRRREAEQARLQAEELAKSRRELADAAKR